MAMTKKEQAQYEDAMVMAKTANNRADRLQAEKDAKEVTLPFEVIAERIDGTNKFLLVIPSMNFSAQLLLRKDKNTLVATKEYVHSEEETNSNEAVRAICERKARNDALATQKNVASQGDVPSAS
mgnify:CR=1 FL=1